MIGGILSDSEHIARYCRAGDVSGGVVQSTAFELREADSYLSVSLLEYFNCSIDTAINAVRFVSGAKPVRGGRFLVLTIGDAKDAVVRGGGTSPSVLGRPTPGDPSHCGLFGYTNDDLQVLNELLVLARSRGMLYPGRLS